MLIDSFLFHSEFDMLEFRLRLLYPYIDKFIIVESDRTFSGAEKSFNALEGRERFDWAKDKLRYCQIITSPQRTKVAKSDSYDPTHTSWKNEYHQRNSIAEWCKDFSDDDILIMGDVDEIPSLEAIEWARNNVRSLPAVCQQDFFYYDLKHVRKEVWCGSIFSTLRTARNIGTQELRNRRNVLPRMTNAGWHLSNFTNVAGIQNKIQSFSHQELCKPEFLDKEHIEKCIATGQDLFNRGVDTVEVKSDFFPMYFREKAKKYKWGI